MSMNLAQKAIEESDFVMLDISGITKITKPRIIKALYDLAINPDQNGILVAFQLQTKYLNA